MRVKQIETKMNDNNVRERLNKDSNEANLQMQP